MKIGILGSSSALGEALAKYLFDKRIDVISIGRRHSDYCQNTKFFDLNQPRDVSEIFDENMDVLVLISWIQKPRNKIAMEKNFIAYSKIIENAHKNNVKIIFISTLGTIGNCKSIHVKYKKLVENLLSINDQILRPATIYSDGKIIGKLSNAKSLFYIKTDLLIPVVELDNVIDVIDKSIFTKSLINPNLIDKSIALTFPFSMVMPKHFLYLKSNFFHIVFKLLNLVKVSFIIDLVDSWRAIFGLQESLTKLPKSSGLDSK
jgi:hypothetical protein